MNSVKYILSDIPGFNEIIKSNDSCSSNILKLNKVECRTSNNTPYKVIKYDKKKLSYDLISSYGLCRSVIVNNNNKVIGFSPPKSIPSDEFINKYNEKDEGIIAEEFIEGTMINVFWDESNESNDGWKISTRNIVGATSSFYKSPESKSFKDMFSEALIENNLKLEDLYKNKCYSFVLQHPENRIVIPFSKTQLYLVGVYSIYNYFDSIQVAFYDAQEYKNYFNNILNSFVKFPEIYTFDTYTELSNKYCGINTPYNIVGVVLHNKLTGERTKLRNPSYEKVRILKGNQPKLQYNYLCLRKEAKVGEFLKYFCENKKNFSIFRDKVHLFTNTLFTNYISCYIKKNKPLLEFSEEYRKHMFNIHQYYLNELKKNNNFVTHKIVINYVNKLHPSILMYCLNFQMRKNTQIDN